MTDLATLNLRVDSREVETGVGQLDRLTASGTKAERATDSMGRQFVKASSAAGQLRMQEAALEAEVQRVIRAQERAVMSSKAQEIANQRLGASTGNLTKSLGSQRAGMQQLSFQLSDMGTMFAMGARPMQIFASQGGQVVQAVQMMSGASGGFIGFLAGPWGIAITAAVTVLASLGAQYLSTASDAEEATSRMDEALERFRTGLPQMSAISSAMTEATRERVGLLAELGRLEQRAGELESGAAASGRSGGALSGQSGMATAARSRIAEIEDEIASIDRRMNAAIDEAAVNNRLDTEAAARSEARTNSVERGTSATRERTAAMSDEERAILQRNRETTSFIGSLEEEIARLTMSTGELRQREILMAQANATTAEQRQQLDELNQAREEAITLDQRAEAAARDSAASTAMAERIRQIENEIILLPLVGQARELAALALEEEEFKARAAAEGLIDLEGAWNRYVEARARQIGEESVLERDAAAARIMAEELEKMIGTLAKMGGVGGAIGGLMGFLNGQETGGTVGSILGTVIGTQTDDSGKTIARTIGDEMRDIFKIDGEFGQTMSGLLEGAGAGVMIGNAVFGGQSTLGQLGSAIGGAAGQAAGAAIAGPIGAMLGKVVGSVLGGAVGGAMAPKGGSATLGNVNGQLDVTGYAGGSSRRRDAAGELAGGVAEIIAQIASELGGTVNSAAGAVSIGLRGDNYRVDTTGGGAVKTGQGAIDFGKDAEAAILFAVSDLINDGVIEGLRQGTANLIKGSKDLEKALSDALQFEGLFNAIENMGLTDYQIALKDLDKDYRDLTALLERAGATAAEYGQLEAYIAEQREGILADQAQAAVDDLSEANSVYVQLLTMLGRGEEALALARLGELAAMDSTLQGLQAMVYELEDARSVIDKFGPLADSLRDFRDVLLGQTATGSSLATAQASFRSTASLAANGDATALGELETNASAYLEAARANASTALDYQRAVGEVLAGVDSGIFAADSQVEYAQLQIDAINRNADIVAGMANMLETYQVAIVENTTSLRRIWERFEGDGLTIKTDADTPIQVEVV